MRTAPTPHPHRTHTAPTPHPHRTHHRPTAATATAFTPHPLHPPQPRSLPRQSHPRSLPISYQERPRHSCTETAGQAHPPHRYFVGAEAMKNDKFKGEDAGFAINGGRGWKDVKFNNHQVSEAGAG